MSTCISLKPPKEFDLENADLDSFKIWLQAFEDFCALSYPTIADEDKCKLFIAVAGLPTRTLLSKLGTDVTKIDKITGSLKKHIQPVKSIVFARHNFFTSKQLPNENISQFMSRLQGLAAACDFEDTKIDSVKNQLVRDQFIVGVSNMKISESLLAAGDVSLEDTLNKAASVDQAAKDVEKINSNSSLFTVTNRLPKRLPKNNVRCYRCQELGHRIADCPQQLTVCAYCKKRGHTQEKCFRKINDTKKCLLLLVTPVSCLTCLLR